MLRASSARVFASARQVAARRFASTPDAGVDHQWSPEVSNATDPWTAQYHMRVEMLLDGTLKIPKADQAAFREKYEISQGHYTLEWCHPSPMPFHTYEELPIIKEIGEKD